MDNTKLNDRTLWYDGDSTIESSSLENWFKTNPNSSHIFVSEITKEIERFNRYVKKEEQITVKETNKPFDYSWNIPDEYKNLNVGNYIAQKFLQYLPTISPDEVKPRTERIVEELNLYEKLGLIEVLRATIYIINTLEKNSCVWGVGRGSSVSSYILYLIGIHDVDSFEYNLDINDFLHE